MIHHCSVGVRDLSRASAFYDAVLTRAGYRRTAEGPKFVGYGTVEGQDPFYITVHSAARAAGPGAHVAFAVDTPEQVHMAYEAGLEAGGSCNGSPGLRASYGPTYFAAYLVDTDGHRIELVSLTRSGDTGGPR